MKAIQSSKSETNGLSVMYYAIFLFSIKQSMLVAQMKKDCKNVENENIR